MLLALSTAAVLLQAPSAASDPPSDKKSAFIASKVDQRHGTSPRRGWGPHHPVWAHNLRTHEIVTLIAGADAVEATTAAIVSWLEAEHPGIEVEVHEGGQPLYPYFLGVE